MRTATRLALGLCVGLLWAGSALAQTTYDVTFQVDMTPYIDSCQFDPDTETVTVPGSMNGWDTSQFPLDDGDDDGTYTGTFPLEAGDITYKFFTSGVLGWEDDTPDRTYTVTTDPTQTIPVVTFADGDPMNQCTGGGVPENYEIFFSVDMTVAIQRGAFDPDAQEVYVAGNLNGWDTSGNPDYRLDESSQVDNLYEGLVQAESLLTPSTQGYKFITRTTAAGDIGWESGPDRTFELTGNEVDADMNGFQEVVVPQRFFDDVGFDDVLTDAATVIFEIDARPAFYVLADSGAIPVAAGAGEIETMINGVWLNGPAMWESDEAEGPGAGITDWLDWNGALEGFPEFGATDMDGDSIYTLTLNYSAGALRTLVGKLGVNGSDNEAGFATDHYYEITEGSQTIDKVFGAIRRESGVYTDDNGPSGGATYDSYILIDNDANPPTVMVVRSGGEADGLNTSIEPGGELPEGLTLSQNYPNPFNPSTSITFEVVQGQDVALRIYDLTGREVAVLVDGFVPAGVYTARFDARDLASGSYLYRLEADGRVISRMMTLLK